MNSYTLPPWKWSQGGHLMGENGARMVMPRYRDDFLMHPDDRAVIAAAPEMLEALKGVAMHAALLPKEEVKKVREAIAKADGQ